uniref:BED-type domain-containing protein n=1 Tax=Nicotiana tabacum TaxID=4097 RepID=A0A1S4BZS2_TOBAC|nr:PREDICTED: uncharacterized protein LOC107813632 [Nicotiana tabacum]
MLKPNSQTQKLSCHSSSSLSSCDSSSSLNCCDSSSSNLKPSSILLSPVSGQSFLQQIQIIMASQNEENLPASSSNVISLDDESQRPLQSDEVVEMEKRRYSRAWNHFEPVKFNGVPYDVCKYCNRRYKNARNYGTKSMLDHIPKCPNRPRDVQNEGDTKGGYFDQDVSRKQLAHAISLHEYPLYS